jgi:hypothetical protein
MCLLINHCEAPEKGDNNPHPERPEGRRSIKSAVRPFDGETSKREMGGAFVHGAKSEKAHHIHICTHKYPVDRGI